MCTCADLNQGKITVFSKPVLLMQNWCPTWRKELFRGCRQASSCDSLMMIYYVLAVSLPLFNCSLARPPYIECPFRQIISDFVFNDSLDPHFVCVSVVQKFDFPSTTFVSSRRSLSQSYIINTRPPSVSLSRSPAGIKQLEHRLSKRRCYWGYFM